MKKVISFILVLCAFVAKAQISGNYSIDWNNKTKLSYDGFSYNVPQFQIRNFYFNDVTKSVFYINTITVTHNVDEQSLQIINPVFENISSAQLGDLDVKSIPTDLKASVKNSKQRNSLSVVLSLSPIIKDAFGYKRLKSFSYNIKEKVNSVSFSKKTSNTFQNSVLASGDWFRFYVEKSGVYKISKSFLQELGMNLNNVDPRNIKVYGNGGRMLPLLNSVEYPVDLAENAVQFVGEEDGVFDSNDYILFYAEGVDNWSLENMSHNNLYASKSYYYVTVGGGNAKRITLAPSPSAGEPTKTISVFDDYQYHEKDLTNVAKLGRKWFGEQFNITESQDFEFNFPNIVTGSPIQLSVACVSVAPNVTTLDIKSNLNPVGTINFGSGEGSERSLNTNIAASEKIKINLKYNNNGVPSSNCYLDFIVLQAVRNLTGYGKQFRFQYNQAASSVGVGQFQFNNSASISQIWDITDIYNVSRYENKAQSDFFFLANLGEVRKYVAIDPADYYSPLRDSQAKVANQNLKGSIYKNTQGVDEDVDYLIVTPAFLNSQAEKLANFHRAHSNLSVRVVNLENIYQEFSAGKQDIAAIRNFVKYVYDNYDKHPNASSASRKLQYLNMFGDASFDFKNRIPNNTNIVPIWHALQSFSPSSSYISDDFFVLLDDNEGDMGASSAKGLDVAVGRMLVRDVAQAEQMVNKVLEYKDSKSFGRWRNNFVLISDDVDVPFEKDLEYGLDELGDKIFSEKPFVNLKKIHSDAYVQESSAGGNRYPKVKEDILKAFDQGAMVFDYFGHGGEDGLAHERIFESADAQNLKNRYKYPLFVTITCEFTRFDNPLRPTCGEFMYWNPAGGAISLVTTTRQININTGQAINEDFAKYLFGFGMNESPSMAEALRMAKVNYTGSNPLEVFYIGDPALKLAMAKPKIVLTKVNDVSTSQTVDVLKALSTIKLSGELRDETGNTLLSDYNGDLAVNIFDKAITRTTLANDGTTDDSGNLIKLTFNNLGETIFKGNASVSNGLFEFSFVVPKDIRIPVGSGRISFYAKKNNQLMDQTGYDTSIQVGGINENAVADNTAPKVKLFMNDETFVSGGITNASPVFLAFLEDENGINTASGIGHDITAVLDGNANNPIVLNEYYETEADNYKKGKVRFQFRDLSPGLHTIVFKAWDVYNNPITAEIQFVVVGDEEIVLSNVLNYPNPFVNYTQFWFSHNKPFEPLDVQVQVMTITGKVVWTKNQVITTDGFLSKDIIWDGKDDFGDRIGKGVYVYKLTVKSTLSNKRAEKFEKLVIL